VAGTAGGGDEGGERGGIGERAGEGEEILGERKTLGRPEQRRVPFICKTPRCPDLEVISEGGIKTN